MAQIIWVKICSHVKYLKELVQDSKILKEINDLEEELKQFGVKINEERESLRSTNAVLHSKLHDLQLKVDHLESQIKKLQLENAEHRDKESKIALGQV